MDLVFVLLCGSEWEDISILLSEEDAIIRNFSTLGNIKS